MEESIKCPRCQSTQLSANKKGFSGGKAVGGALLFGELGLLAGASGSNKVLITCLSCGKQFEPGNDFNSAKIKKQQWNEVKTKPLFWAIYAGVLVTIILLFKSCF